MQEFYSPGEIHFTRQQCVWLIQNLGYLRGGYWPTIPSDFVPGKKSGKGKAYFETPIEYAAEIEERLEYVGEDGLILEAIESWGKTDESLARYFRKPVWLIRKRAKRALNYVASGPSRRWHDTKKRQGETYQAFKERKKHER